MTTMRDYLKDAPEYVRLEAEAERAHDRADRLAQRGRLKAAGREEDRGGDLDAAASFYRDLTPEEQARPPQPRVPRGRSR